VKPNAKQVSKELIAIFKAVSEKSRGTEYESALTRLMGRYRVKIKRQLLKGTRQIRMRKGRKP
jgi:hypothetical protein